MSPAASRTSAPARWQDYVQLLKPRVMSLVVFTALTGLVCAGRPMNPILGAVAILLKSEFVLAFVGALFVAEMMSVILQRYVFKYHKWRRGAEYAQTHRVFRRAPLHHHFEELGWKESQVVVRFWIIGILCAFVALSTLKLR